MRCVCECKFLLERGLQNVTNIQIIDERNLFSRIIWKSRTQLYFLFHLTIIYLTLVAKNIIKHHVYLNQLFSQYKLCPEKFT